MKKILLPIIIGFFCLPSFASKKSKIRVEKRTVSTLSHTERMALSRYIGIIPKCRLLLHRNIDFQEITLKGCSPLHRAIRQSNSNILSLLLNVGVDVNKKGYWNEMDWDSSKYETPLDCAFEIGARWEIIKKLIIAGAKLKIEHIKWYMKRNDCNHLNQLLEQLRKKINMLDEEQYTLLDFAKQKRVQRYCISTLKKYGAKHSTRYIKELEEKKERMERLLEKVNKELHSVQKRKLKKKNSHHRTRRIGNKVKKRRKTKKKQTRGTRSKPGNPRLGNDLSQNKLIRINAAGDPVLDLYGC